MITINIDGAPIAWKRPGQRKIGCEVYTYDPQKKEKEQIRWQMRAEYREDLLKVPLKVDIKYFLPIAKSASKKRHQQMREDFIKPMKRPDIDNCAKFTLDCMTGCIFSDDSQITELNLKKQYSDCPRTSIKIFPFSNNIAPEPDDDDELDDFYSDK